MGRIENEYRVGDALEVLKSLPGGIARVVHLDDAWARPGRCGGMGTDVYDTHDLEKSFAIIDECWRIMEEGAWIILDADDWFKRKVETYLCEEYGDVAETYEGGGYRRSGGVTYQSQDGSVDCGGAGMYLRNGGFHVVFGHKGETDTVYESARQIARRPTKKFGWKSVKPVDPYRAWIEALSEEGDLIVEPCAGTGPGSIAAHQLNRRWLAIDNSASARESFHKRKSHMEPSVNTTLADIGISADN